LVVPFVRRAPADGGFALAPLGPATNVGERSIERSFIVGSEWLYVKIYAGQATVDELLVETVRELVAAGMASGAIKEWFFIRYSDPDWHLRLRMRGAPTRLVAEVLPAISAAVTPLRKSGHVWRMQCDTYEREVERYGGPIGVVLSERLFAVDSEAVVALLGAMDDESPTDVRWQLGFIGLHSMLEALGFTLQEMHAVARDARRGAGMMSQEDAALAHQLGARFRGMRSLLDQLLDGTLLSQPGLAAFDPELARRDNALRGLGAELRAAEARRELSVPLSQLAGSYMHMYTNRLFASSARAHELVLYDFLERSYLSKLARSGQKPR
jgi:thiopeptide-type bacteriocin biosynthesis protein